MWDRLFGGVPGQNERLEGGNPHSRRLAAIPSNSVAINSLIAMYGRTVVGRSRYLCTNNPYAVSAKEQWVASLAGTGIKPSSLVTDRNMKKALQQLWLDWTDEADYDGLSDFYGLQAMAAAELFEGGECFIRYRANPDNVTVPMQVQVLPTEMLPYRTDVLTGSGNRIELGIEFDANGKRVAYHFYQEHPGQALPRRTAATVRVPADEILHLFRPLRAGQIRGIPQSVASMARLAMLDLYDDAELERKRTTALFAGFITKEATEDEDDHPLGVKEHGSLSTTLGNDQVTMEGGALIDLNPGEDISFAAPADVGTSYDPFQYRNLLQIAAGFGVPYSAMTGDLTRANYGSLRAGELSHRRRVQAYQHNVMIYQMCRPIWLRFLAMATALGEAPWQPSEYMANARDYNRVKWIPPKWDWVDPLKDRQAEKVAVDNGWKSRSDVIEEEGYDPEEMDDRIAADQARADELELRLALPDGTQPEPEPDPNDGEGNQNQNDPNQRGSGEEGAN
jgi:lambda family phage portal protein